MYPGVRAGGGILTVPSRLITVARVPSFFSRVAHYTPTHGKTPKEDMLTQAFCAVLEAVPEWAVSLAESWWKRALETNRVDSAPRVGALTHERFRARPQRRTGGLWRVDLELRFGPLGYPDGLIWIENKVDSGLSGETQLVKYDAQLRHEPAGERLLVFLTRAGGADDAAGFIPDETLCVDWDEVGRHLSEWHKGRPADADGYTRRIVDEFIAHLDEEGISVIDRPLELSDIAALGDYSSAVKKLEHLMEQVREGVEKAAPSRGLSLNPGRSWAIRPGAEPAPSYWQVYDAPDFPGAWLEFQLGQREDFNHALMFGAGLTVESNSELLENAPWLEELARSDFEPRTEGNLQRVWRWFPLVAVVAEDGPVGQAEQLRDLVLDAFAVLIVAGPPLGSASEETTL